LRALTIDLLLSAATYRDDQLVRLAIELRHRRTQLLQVRGTGSHEQLVVLAGERPALLHERLQHRNDLRGRPVFQVDDFQRLPQNGAGDQAKADQDPRQGLDESAKRAHGRHCASTSAPGCRSSSQGYESHYWHPGRIRLRPGRVRRARRPLGALWQPSELLIIGGAAIGALIIANPMRVTKRVAGGFVTLLKGAKYRRTTTSICSR
jgi:hypothetical protein